MKQSNKTPYLVLCLLVVSFVCIFISTLTKSYAFSSAFLHSYKFVAAVPDYPWTMFVDEATFKERINTITGGNIGNITAFERVNKAPTIFTNVIYLNTANSVVPIYGWYDANPTYRTLSYYSATHTIYMPINSYQMFGSASGESPFTNLEFIDTTGWSFSQTTNTKSMFQSMPALRRINANFRDGWGVQNMNMITDMSFMFANSTKIQALDVSTWGVTSAVNMKNMFASTTALQTLDVSGWKTNKVTNMSYMFASSGVTSLNLAGWNTGVVTNMAGMFYAASYLTGVGNIYNWNTAKVSDMYRMFASTTRLTTLSIYNWDTRAVKNMSRMFSYAYNLPGIGLDNWNTYQVTNMYQMFYYANRVKVVVMNKVNSSAVTNVGYVFSGMSNLQYVKAPASIKAGYNLALPKTMYRGTNPYSTLTSTTPAAVWYCYTSPCNM